MTESDDVQALEKISSEVDESQFKIILTSQCIKAQEFLVQKLLRQCEQSKQICNFISNGNLKLESEIRLGEQELKSLRSALETIKSANVELEKGLLLVKEDKIDLLERVNTGIKKYEELWLTSKKKYDDIPFIKKKLLIINKKKNLEDSIACLDTDIQKLTKDFEERKNDLANIDRQRIIHIATYMVLDRPKVLNCLKEKTEEVNKLLGEIKEVHNDQDCNTSKKMFTKVDTKIIDETLFVDENKYSDGLKNDAILLPKLQLQNIDLDSLTDKLEQVKSADYSFIRRVDSITIQIDKNPPKKINQDNIKDIYVSSYFKNIDDIKSYEKGKESQTINYTDKKLIHILEDIQLPKNDAFSIFTKLNPNEFHDVTLIKASIQSDKTNESPQKNNSEEVDEMEVIEEIDLTGKNSGNTIVPPTQFLDLSQNSQEKKVTFSKVVSVQEVDANMNKSPGCTAQGIPNSELNSVASDSSYHKIKENIFKKYNLALSPEFTYLKNPVITKISDDVKSKFFDDKNINSHNQTQDMNVDQNMNAEVKETSSNDVAGSKQEQSIAGFLFTHGAKGIQESLDVSTISNCVEDVDNEFPHCYDSSLLLSPKADTKLPEDADKNALVLSQEVPNFLTGFKKVGFSFFGNSSSDNNPDSNNRGPNDNFNFSFGNTEKKTRGGFFNMFG